MAIVGKRTDPVRLFARRVGLLALTVVVLVALSALWDVYKKERESRQLRLEAEIQLKDLTAQQDHLSSEITRLKTERGKEEMLRENYEMARDGEKMIVIIEPPQAEAVQASSSPIRTWLHRFLPFW